ncbi:hypothetical protein AVEN_114677-1 [Araneus ventricosus]|uniref:Uncharacterized protein n=1 Tax=Araneus ventricosus TaxID=182803 RepID=A0A4Y2C1C4_ARAVE|nr:hypothetical protein AVEN_114677-1 [Araneus ventricosus]
MEVSRKRLVVTRLRHNYRATFHGCKSKGSPVVTRLRARITSLHFMEVKSKEVTSGYASSSITTGAAFHRGKVEEVTSGYASSSITTGAAFHGGKVERGHQWVKALA